MSRKSRRTGCLHAGLGLYEGRGASPPGRCGPGHIRRMNVHHTPAVPVPRQERGALIDNLARLWPYIWPADRPDLRLRVIGSLVVLLAAKLATVAVPFTFKWATDALAGHPSAPACLS